MTTVLINGVSVDIDNPCEVASELKKAELIIATGGGVAMTRFGEDEVRWSAANAARLRELIERYENECAASQGRRRRYAKSMRFV